MPGAHVLQAELTIRVGEGGAPTVASSSLRTAATPRARRVGGLPTPLPLLPLADRRDHARPRSRQPPVAPLHQASADARRPRARLGRGAATGATRPAGAAGHVVLQFQSGHTASPRPV